MYSLSEDKLEVQMFGYLFPAMGLMSNMTSKDCSQAFPAVCREFHQPCLVQGPAG